MHTDLELGEDHHCLLIYEYLVIANHLSAEEEKRSSVGIDMSLQNELEALEILSLLGHLGPLQGAGASTSEKVWLYSRFLKQQASLQKSA